MFGSLNFRSSASFWSTNEVLSNNTNVCKWDVPVVKLRWCPTGQVHVCDVFLCARTPSLAEV